MSNELNSLKEKALSPGFDIEQYLSEDRTYFKKNLASIRAGCGSGKTHSFFSSIFQADVPEENGRLLNILVAPQINMLEVSEHNRKQGIEKDIPILYGFADEYLFGNEKMKAPLQGTMRSENIKSLYNIYECFEYLFDQIKYQDNNDLGINSKERWVLQGLVPRNMKPDETVEGKDKKKQYTKLKRDVYNRIHDALSCHYCKKWDWNKGNKGNIDKKKHYIKDVSEIYSRFYKDIKEKDINEFLDKVYEVKLAKEDKREYYPPELKDKRHKRLLLELKDFLHNKGIDINILIMNIVVRIFMPIEVSRFKSMGLTMTAAKFNKARFYLLKYSKSVPQKDEPTEIFEDDPEFDEEELFYNRSSLFHDSKLPYLISIMGKDGHHSYLSPKCVEGFKGSAWDEVKSYLRNELTNLFNDMALGSQEEDRKGSFFSPSEIVDICMTDDRKIRELFDKVRENRNDNPSKILGGRIDYLNRTGLEEKEEAIRNLSEKEGFCDEIIGLMLSSNGRRTPMLRRIRTHLNEYEEGLKPEDAERRRHLKGCCYRLIMFTGDSTQANYDKADYYQFSDKFTPFVSVFLDEELAFHKDFVDETSKSCILMRTDKGEERGDNYFGGIATLSRVLYLCSDAMDTRLMDKENVKNYSRIGNMFVSILKGSMIKDDGLFKFYENGNEVNLLEKSAKDIIQGLYQRLKPFEGMKNGLLIKESDLRDIGYTFNAIPIETIKSFNYVCVIDENRRETILMSYNDYSEIKDDKNISMVSLEAICYLLCILDIVRYNIGADSVNKYIDNEVTQDSIGASLWKNIKESRFIEFDVSYGADNRIVDALSALLDVSIYASLGIIQGLAQNKDRTDGYIYVGLDMRSLGVSPESMIMMMLHNSKCRCVMMSATSHIPGSVARYFNVDNMKRISKDYFDRPERNEPFLRNLVRFHQYEDIEVEIAGQRMKAGKALRYTTLQRNIRRGGISFHRVEDKRINTLTMTYGDDGSISCETGSNNKNELLSSGCERETFDDTDNNMVWYQSMGKTESGNKKSNITKETEYREIEYYINLMVKLRKNALIMANSTSSHITKFIKENSLYERIKNRVKDINDTLFDEKLKEILSFGSYSLLSEGIKKDDSLKAIWKSYSEMVAFKASELTTDMCNDRFKELPFMGGSLGIMKSVVVMAPECKAYNSKNNLLDYDEPGYTYLMAYEADVGKDPYFRDFLGEGNSDGLHQDTRIILVSAYVSSKQGVNFKLRYQGKTASRDLDALCLCNLPYWNEIREKETSTSNFLELKDEVKTNKKTKPGDKFKTPKVSYRDNSLTSVKNRQVHKNIMAKSFHGLLVDRDCDFQSLMSEARGRERGRLSEVDVKTIERVEQCYCSNLKGSLENIISPEVDYAQCEELIQTMGRIDRADRQYQEGDDSGLFRYPNIFFSESKNSNVYQFMASMFQRLDKLAEMENNDLFLDSLGMTCMSFMSVVTDDSVIDEDSVIDDSVTNTGGRIKKNPWFSHSIFKEDVAREAFKRHLLKSCQEHEKASKLIYGNGMERMRNGETRYKWIINFNRIMRYIYGDNDSLSRMYKNFFSSRGFFTEEDFLNLESCPTDFQDSFIIMLTRSFYLRCIPFPALDEDIGSLSDIRKSFKEKVDNAINTYGFLPLVDTDCCDDTICSKDKDNRHRHVLEGQVYSTISPSIKIETVKGTRSLMYLCDAMEGQSYKDYLRKMYQPFLNIYHPDDNKKTVYYKGNENNGSIEIHLFKEENHDGKRIWNDTTILTIPQEKKTDQKLCEEIYKALDKSLRKSITLKNNKKKDNKGDKGEFCLNDLQDEKMFKGCFPSPAMIPMLKGNLAEYIISSTLKEFLKCSYIDDGKERKFGDVLKLNGNTDKSSDFGDDFYKIEELYDICLSRVDGVSKSLFIDVKAYARGLNKANFEENERKVKEKAEKIKSFMSGKCECDTECDTERIKANTDYIMLNIFSEERTIGDTCDRIGFFMPMLTEATGVLTQNRSPLYYFNSRFVSKIANLITDTNV